MIPLNKLTEEKNNTKKLAYSFELMKLLSSKYQSVYNFQVSAALEIILNKSKYYELWPGSVGLCKPNFNERNKSNYSLNVRLNNRNESFAILFFRHKVNQL